MTGALISTQDEFDRLVEHLHNAPAVAWDTEFVSERSYRPRLCLLQIATEERRVAVDPLAEIDLSAWWRFVASSDKPNIVHGGREEIRFCLRYAGAAPSRLFDVQIAEGLLTRNFPTSYKNLVQRVLGRGVHGAETRTDWEHRPLSPGQIAYAVEDVEHLLPVWRKQTADLAKLERGDWATAEMSRFTSDVQAEADREGWRRLPQANRFSPRELAIARELWSWREQYAEQIDRPARVAFRDDLMTEIVRRKPATVRDLNATRGMQRRDYQRAADDILAAVRAGVAVPDAELPRRSDGKPSQHDDVLTKLLSIVLADRCAELGVALTLVGAVADVQDFVHWHVIARRRPPRPRLMQGWRELVCGDLLDDILDGRVAFRVANARSENPLRYERLGEKPPSGE